MAPKWVSIAACGLIACGSTSEPGTERTEKPEPPGKPTPTAPGKGDSKGGIAGRVEEVRKQIGDEPAWRWATYQGNNARTGDAPDVPAIGRPKVKWSAEIGIQGYLNAPLVLGSKVVVPSSGRTHNAPDPLDGLHARDAATGKELWHARSLSDANGAAAADGVVVFTSDDARVRAVAESNGEVKWERQGTVTVYSTPVILGDLVVVGDSAGSVLGLALDTGDVRWEVRLAGAIRGGLAADAKTIYAVSQGGEVAAIDPSGAVRWSKQVTRPGFGGSRSEAIEGYNAPAVTADLLIVPFARDTYYSTGAAMLALSTRDGSEAWRAVPGSVSGDWGNVRSSPAVADGMVIWGEAYSADVVALGASSGVPKWRTPAGTCHFPHYGSAVVASGRAYVPRYDGHLSAVDISSGTLAWRYYLGEHDNAGDVITTGGSCSWGDPTIALYAPPALDADGTIYVGTGEGWLFALTAP